MRSGASRVKNLSKSGLYLRAQTTMRAERKCLQTRFRRNKRCILKCIFWACWKRRAFARRKRLCMCLSKVGKHAHAVELENRSCSMNSLLLSSMITSRNELCGCKSCRKLEQISAIFTASKHAFFQLEALKSTYIMNTRALST